MGRQLPVNSFLRPHAALWSGPADFFFPHSHGSQPEKRDGGCNCASLFRQMSVRKPAPAFTADAVVNGEFKTVSLSDYAGNSLLHSNTRVTVSARPCVHGAHLRNCP